MSAFGAALLLGCTAPVAAPSAGEASLPRRPLETLPPRFDPALVRQDLLATAAERFGAKALEEARAAPTHLIVKRFAGLAPPPPPGAGPDWRAPTPAALLVRRQSGWLVAQAGGWRPADAAAAAELDSLFADDRFWNEPAYTPPCPDFGGSLLLLRRPGHGETVRNSTCMSMASRAVEAALRA